MIDTLKIKAMRRGGRKLSAVRNKLAAAVKPGISLRELDTLADTLLHQTGGEPGFKLVPGYNWATCINVNQGVVHGIPDTTKLNLGDLVSLDLGLYFEGFHTDTSISLVVGPPNPTQAHFLSTGTQALTAAIAAAKPGNFIGHISQVIQTTVEAQGFNCVRQLTGHGIGKNLHEPPSVPCVLLGDIHHTPELLPGMTLAIEVIYTTGNPTTQKTADGWTIVTQDSSLAGLFEETVLITRSGAEILTQA